MTSWEPLLSLLSFCHVSLCLHHCPVSSLFFYFLLFSVFPGLCSVAQFCLRHPSTSPLPISSLLPFRLLPPSLSSSSICLFILLFLSRAPSPSHHLPRDRKGSHLNVSTILFVSSQQERFDLKQFLISRRWLTNLSVSQCLTSSSCIWAFVAMFALFTCNYLIFCGCFYYFGLKQHPSDRENKRWSF